MDNGNGNGNKNDNNANISSNEFTNILGVQCLFPSKVIRNRKSRCILEGKVKDPQKYKRPASPLEDVLLVSLHQQNLIKPAISLLYSSVPVFPCLPSSLNHGIDGNSSPREDEDGNVFPLLVCKKPHSTSLHPGLAAVYKIFEMESPSSSSSSSSTVAATTTVLMQTYSKLSLLGLSRLHGQTNFFNATLCRGAGNGARDNRLRFIIFQMLQVIAHLHSLGLCLESLGLGSFLVDEDMWVTVPFATSTRFFHAVHDLLHNNNNSGDKHNNNHAYNHTDNNNNNNNNMKQSQSTMPLERPIGHRETVLSKWLTGKMSNFEYLMLLNDAAGRKLIDPVYHPILPWVTDFSNDFFQQTFGQHNNNNNNNNQIGSGYTGSRMLPASSSSSSSSSSFSRNELRRDLTKSKFRLSKGDGQLEVTYTHSEPPHHVPESLSELTYYIYMARRTPMHVLCRVVREYFVPEHYPTSMMRIYEWTPDECIPEFYTDVSVFASIHKDMGLQDIELPSFANTAEEFIRYHRAVLESPEVSQQLHHWIDVTFGYCLSGEAAVQRLNVPLKQTLSSSEQIGDTPKLDKHPGFVSLFSIPHPQRHRNNCFSSHDNSNDDSDQEDNDDNDKKDKKTKKERSGQEFREEMERKMQQQQQQQQQAVLSYDDVQTILNLETDWKRKSKSSVDTSRNNNNNNNPNSTLEDPTVVPTSQVNNRSNNNNSSVSLYDSVNGTSSSNNNSNSNNGSTFGISSTTGGAAATAAAAVNALTGRRLNTNSLPLKQQQQQQQQAEKKKSLSKVDDDLAATILAMAPNFSFDNNNSSNNNKENMGGKLLSDFVNETHERAFQLRYGHVLEPAYSFPTTTYKNSHNDNNNNKKSESSSSQKSYRGSMDKDFKMEFEQLSQKCKEWKQQQQQQEQSSQTGASNSWSESVLQSQRDDLFSLGCCLCELYTGTPLFSVHEAEAIYSQRHQQQQSSSSSSSSAAHHDLIHLVSKRCEAVPLPVRRLLLLLLHPDVDDGCQPTAVEILNACTHTEHELLDQYRPLMDNTHFVSFFSHEDTITTTTTRNDGNNSSRKHYDIDQNNNNRDGIKYTMGPRVRLLSSCCGSLFPSTFLPAYQLIGCLKMSIDELDRFKTLVENLDEVLLISLEGLNLVLPHVLAVMAEPAPFRFETTTGTMAEEEIGTGNSSPNSRQHSISSSSPSPAMLLLQEKERLLREYMSLVDFLGSRLGLEATEKLLFPRVIQFLNNLNSPQSLEILLSSHLWSILIIRGGIIPFLNHIFPLLLTYLVSGTLHTLAHAEWLHNESDSIAWNIAVISQGADWLQKSPLRLIRKVQQAAVLAITGLAEPISLGHGLCARYVLPSLLCLIGVPQLAAAAGYGHTNVMAHASEGILKFPDHNTATTSLEEINLYIMSKAVYHAEDMYLVRSIVSLCFQLGELVTTEVVLSKIFKCIIPDLMKISAHPIPPANVAALMEIILILNEIMPSLSADAIVKYYIQPARHGVSVPLPHLLASLPMTVCWSVLDHHYVLDAENTTVYTARPNKVEDYIYSWRMRKFMTELCRLIVSSSMMTGATTCVENVLPSVDVFFRKFVDTFGYSSISLTSTTMTKGLALVSELYNPLSQLVGTNVFLKSVPNLNPRFHKWIMTQGSANAATFSSSSSSSAFPGEEDLPDTILPELVLQDKSGQRKRGMFDWLSGKSSPVVSTPTSAPTTTTTAAGTLSRVPTSYGVSMGDEKTSAKTTSSKSQPSNQTQTTKTTNSIPFSNNDNNNNNNNSSHDLLSPMEKKISDAAERGQIKQQAVQSSVKNTIELEDMPLLARARRDKVKDVARILQLEAATADLSEQEAQSIDVKEVIVADTTGKHEGKEGNKSVSDKDNESDSDNDTFSNNDYDDDDDEEDEEEGDNNVRKNNNSNSNKSKLVEDETEISGEENVDDFNRRASGVVHLDTLLHDNHDDTTPTTTTTTTTTATTRGANANGVSGSPSTLTMLKATFNSSLTTSRNIVIGTKQQQQQQQQQHQHEKQRQLINPAVKENFKKLIHHVGFGLPKGRLVRVSSTEPARNNFFILNNNHNNNHNNNNDGADNGGSMSPRSLLMAKGIGPFSKFTNILTHNEWYQNVKKIGKKSMATASSATSLVASMLIRHNNEEEEEEENGDTSVLTDLTWLLAGKGRWNINKEIKDKLNTSQQQQQQQQNYQDNFSQGFIRQAPHHHHHHHNGRDDAISQRQFSVWTPAAQISMVAPRIAVDSGSEATALFSLRMANKSVFRIEENHEGGVKLLMTDKSESLLLASSKSGVRIYSLATHPIKPVSLYTHQNTTSSNNNNTSSAAAATSGGFARNGLQVVTCNGTIDVWDLETRKALVHLNPQERNGNYYDSVAPSFTHMQLISPQQGLTPSFGNYGDDQVVACLGSSLCFYDLRLRSKSLLKTISEFVLPPPIPFAFNPLFSTTTAMENVVLTHTSLMDNLVVAGSAAGSLWTLDRRMGRVISSWAGHESAVIKTQALDDHRFLTMSERSAYIWSTKTANNNNNNPTDDEQQLLQQQQQSFSNNNDGNSNNNNNNNSNNNNYKNAGVTKVLTIKNMPEGGVNTNSVFVQNFELNNNRRIKAMNDFYLNAKPVNLPVLYAFAGHRMLAERFPNFNEPDDMLEMKLNKSYFVDRNKLRIQKSQMNISSATMLPMRRLLLVGTEDGLIRVVS